MADDIPLLSKKAVLVGNPNVGKSVIFRLLTGSYVLVSNFPGTTVEVSRGRMQLGGINYTYKLDGLQIGVINIAWGKDSIWKVLPIVNANW